jgi:hypothetical protein
MLLFVKSKLFPNYGVKVKSDFGASLQLEYFVYNNRGHDRANHEADIFDHGVHFCFQKLSSLVVHYQLFSYYLSVLVIINLCIIIQIESTIISQD